MEYYNKSEKDVLLDLKTSRDGLTTQEVNNLIGKYGLNKIVEKKGKSKFKIFMEQFNDLMIIILLVVALFMGLYGFLYTHEYTDTIVIVVVVLINAIMGFVQQEKAEVTLNGLKKYSTSTCKVKRDGKIKIIDSEYIVPGDIILLEAGDKIVADARIINESNLQVDESPLTGESLPVKKMAKTLKGKHIIQEQVNMVFCGCHVVNGTAEAIVVKTAMNTELGCIANSLNTPYEVETPLEIKMKEISKKLTCLIFIVILFIFVYGVLNDYKLIEIIMLCVSLAVAVIPEGLPAVITITLSSGAAALAKKKSIVRQMSAIETLGSMDIICSDKTGTITQNKMQVKEIKTENEEMLKNIMLCANETIIDNNEFVGDPTETALYEYLKDNNFDIEKYKNKYERLISAPFDSERKLMSSINVIDGKTYMLVKGSVENLLACCKCDSKQTKQIKKEELEMAQNALRVIGFAYKEIKKVPTDVDKVFAEEKDLNYVGMVGMIDPPREDVKDAVKKCQEAGIRPIMITGDSLITACAIAKNIGIIKEDSEGILGSQLDEYTDEELVNVVKKYSVYARVSPAHKTRIVKAWQANKKVVAMTGDGVNDAPAIKDAHVGVGMGITGTEVTKSVADIILLDDSFSTIVTAAEEGRRIFDNIKNNIVYSLSSNFAELFIILIGLFKGVTILLPIQILFIDLVTDSIPSICLAFEKKEKNIMKQPPRGIDKPLFTPFVIATIIYSSLVESILALSVYFITVSYYGINLAATFALLTIVAQEILYAISCRNLKEFTYKQGLFSNKYMNIGIIVVILIQLLVFITPLGSLIHVSKINLSHIVILSMFNLFGFVLYELGKPIINNLFKD